MAKTEIQRNANYIYGLNADRISAKVTAKKPQMVSDVSTQVGSLASHYRLFQGIIAGQAVGPLGIGMYWSFCEVLYRRTLTLAGGQLIAMVAADLAAFTARGCNAGILNQLRDGVFGIPASLTSSFTLKLTTVPDAVAYSISPGFGGHVVTGTTLGETPIQLDPDVLQTITCTKALYKTFAETIKASTNEVVSSTVTMVLA